MTDKTVEEMQEYILRRTTDRKYIIILAVFFTALYAGITNTWWPFFLSVATGMLSAQITEIQTYQIAVFIALQNKK